MINTTRQITAQDRFLNADGTPFKAPGNFSESTVEHHINNGGFLYVAPSPSDAEKVGAYIPVMQAGVQVGITKELVEKTAAEVEAEIQATRQMMSVSPWQMRKALNLTGRRDAVEAVLLGADRDTIDGWEYATEFQRLNPLVGNLGIGLGLTEADLDALFELAMTL